MNAAVMLGWIISGLGIVCFWLCLKHPFGWLAAVFQQCLYFPFVWLTHQWGFLLHAVGYSSVFIHHFIVSWRNHKLPEDQRVKVLAG